LFREIIAVYCENHTEHINGFTLCGKVCSSWILRQVVHVITVLLENVAAKGNHEISGQGYMLSGSYTLMRLDDTFLFGMDCFEITLFRLRLAFICSHVHPF
jgi:hypothetical protein